MILTPADHPLGPCPRGHDPFDPESCSHCKQRVPPSEWVKRLSPGPRFGKPSTRVTYCSSRRMYDWAVTDPFGRSLATGTERTESAAKREAETAATDRGPDREFRAVRRNLLYHLLPVRGRWQWHAAQLIPRLGLFNGRKIIAVLTGDAIDRTTNRGAVVLDPPDVVEPAFPGCEFVRIANDPARRELVSFLPLFSSLDPAEGDVTLYAQSKGVTRPVESTSRRWTEILYETHLDYWPLVERLLATRPLAGAFKKIGRGWDGNGWTDREFKSASDWHYSGSWLWFRNKDVFGVPGWRNIEPFWSGIESWPALHFPADESATIFFDGRVPETNLYNWDYVSRIVEPAYARWKAEHAGDKT
jgi:hypothetical protein